MTLPHLTDKLLSTVREEGKDYLTRFLLVSRLTVEQRMKNVLKEETSSWRVVPGDEILDQIAAKAAACLNEEKEDVVEGISKISRAAYLACVMRAYPDDKGPPTSETAEISPNLADWEDAFNKFVVWRTSFLKKRDRKNQKEEIDLQSKMLKIIFNMNSDSDESSEEEEDDNFCVVKVEE